MVRVFINGPGDRGSIPSRVIPKTQKMISDASLLNTQHYKVRIRGTWSNLGKGITPSQQLNLVAIEKDSSGRLQLLLDNLSVMYIIYKYIIYIYIYMCVCV